MSSKRYARFTELGMMAISPKAWGAEFAILGGEGEARKPYELDGSVAIVDICGPLMQRPHWLFDDYESIGKRVKAALAAPEVPLVVLRIDSPGGSAGGCFELARELRAMAQASGKRLYAWTDTVMASAAYAIATAASEIYASPTAQVGSIGVFEALANQVALDKAMGFSFTFVTSGSKKLHGNEHLPTTAEAVAEAQGQVDTLAGLFFDLVAENRPVTRAEIQGLEGGIFLGVDAVNSGLIESTDVWAGFLARISNPQGNTMTVQAGAQASKAESEEKDPDAWQAVLATLHAEADGEDEEKAARAKRMLKAMYDEDEQTEDKKEEKEAKATASSNELDLAAQFHALKAEVTKERDGREREALLATRPDFSAEVRKTLSGAPMETVRNAVKSWPRVNATPEAAANAMTPAATPAAKPTGHQADPALNPEQQALLDKVYGKKPLATAAKQVGTEFSVSYFDPEVARKRLAELKGGN